ncbi:MAG: tRNA (adenosine(37)-N6)-threonylcarbamoyltransferase complex ATPase subunit type 1 TsaE [Sphingobacteriales bacterium]|nr:MAG: tRNA (adenosine(37)-N6)-threonylcarbamoyltransferase complex ATPase subunit type 1 TsaE [Sphingobacteriales bacterium]
MQATFTLNTIQEVAQQCWAWLGENPVVALHGDMGAGKTTFVHALCDVKGVEDAVSSPTFSIINEYGYTENGEMKLMYHLDLYRLNSEEEAIRAGVEDCLYSKQTCLVEWPERAPQLFPPNSWHIYIDLLNNDSRRLRIERK